MQTESVRITQGRITSPVTLMLGRYVLVPLARPEEQAVSKEFGVSVIDLHRHVRTRRIADARIALYRILSESDLNQSEIARLIGNRNPGTVHYGLKQSDNLEQTDPDYRAKIQAARAALKG